jgi:3-oxoacyl-[acyl-carrier protein] reductase
MLLENKNTVIYGAGGSVGAATARAFAREGARVFLAGRTLATLDAVADELRAAGAAAETAVVDVHDEHAVERHIEQVLELAGRIDVTFNAVSSGDNQGTPLVDMPADDIGRPLRDRIVANHLTARAAARRMITQRSGVVLMITATPARMAFPLTGSFGVECAAVEGLCRSLASELGPHGVRVVCLRSAGSPDTPGIDGVFDLHGGRKTLADLTLLGRLPTLADVANVATLMASDRAGAITGTVANVTAGTIVD